MHIVPPFSIFSALRLFQQAVKQQLPRSAVDIFRSAMTKYNALRGFPNPFDRPVVASLVTGFRNLTRARLSGPEAAPQPSKAAAPARASAMDGLAAMALNNQYGNPQRVCAAGLFLAFALCLRPKSLFHILPSHLSIVGQEVHLTLAHEKTGGRFDQRRVIRFTASPSNPLFQCVEFVLSLSLPQNSPIWPESSKGKLVGLLREAHDGDIGGIALNSLRPGGASCARLFAPKDTVMQWGNWTSQAVNRYLRDSYVPPREGTLLHRTMMFLFRCGT